jgi:hypothetical protein
MVGGAGALVLRDAVAHRPVGVSTGGADHMTLPDTLLGGALN